MSKVALALDALLTRYENLFKGENLHNLPCVEFDPAWPSECVEKVDGAKHYWRHTQKDSSDLFASMESALELEFHPDFKNFYSNFWSNGIFVEHPDVDFALIQTWNQEDEDSLKENILGHCFAKMKSRLPMTMFIGCTNSNEVIVIDNETGMIQLERPGRKAHKVLADSLESFLLSLKPTMDNYT